MDDGKWKEEIKASIVMAKEIFNIKMNYLSAIRMWKWGRDLRNVFSYELKRQIWKGGWGQGWDYRNVGVEKNGQN